MHRVAAVVVSAVLLLSIPVLAGVDVPLQRRQDAGFGDLIPLASWQKRFEITEGQDRGRIVPVTLRRDPVIAGRWQLSFGDYAAILIRNDAARGPVMERLDLFKSRSYIVYEPALPIPAAEPTPGGMDVSQAVFQMFHAGTGKLKRSGRVTHRMKQVLSSRFDTPAGLIDGYYVLIEHRMDMRYAELDMTLAVGFRSHEGPIFGSGQYTLTKLGLFKEKKTVAAALTTADSGGVSLH